MSSISLSLAFVSKTACILSPFRSTNVARLKWNVCHFPTLWYTPPKPWKGKEQRKEKFLGYKDRFLKCVGGHAGKQNGKYLRPETETRCRTESVAWLVLLQSYYNVNAKWQNCVWLFWWCCWGGGPLCFHMSDLAGKPNVAYLWYISRKNQITESKDKW